LKESRRNLENSFKDLQKQYAKILPPEKQAAFAKWRADKNQKIGQMTNPELAKETMKLMGSLRKQMVQNHDLARQELQQKRRDRLNKQPGQGALR